ncbi:MAG: DEAD/DEAH box helicase [Chloroflexota bacterium]
MKPQTPDSVKARLRRTWPAFFARYGNLTAIQVAAIPPILDGTNTLLFSATASGKTEAAVVPLIERLFFTRQAKVRANSSCPNSLDVLFICPTRALTRDLYERLAAPLDELRISLAMKTGDTAGISYQSPPSFLITTPESTDSMLTRAPRIFTQLRAIVLDEIHLFDNGPRGDHLLCILKRIEHIRRYYQEQNEIPKIPLQRIALSATVPDPKGLAERYLREEQGAAENSQPEAGNQDELIDDESSRLIRQRSSVLPSEISPSGLSETRDKSFLARYTQIERDDSASTEQDDEPPYQIVSVAGQRELDAIIEPMNDLFDLAMHMNHRARDPVEARKSLVFCNTRNEVEETAAFLRRRLDYNAAVFVHYSNLDGVLRQEVEADFAAAPVAVCVCTSTLELGIDIGSIDDVVLIGAPPTLTSFLQRIGRAGRRTSITRVLCLSRSRLEELRFESLIALAHENRLALAPPTYHFRASVLVQQIFSILKQSPTGAIRRPDLRRVAPDTLSDQDLSRIFQNLGRQKYLKGGRIGEWRPGPMLDELLDAHEIYSNIGSDPLAYQIVDAFSGRTIAQTERLHMEGDTLLLGGRTLEVVWRDRNRIGVARHESSELATEVRFATAPFALSLEVSQGIARYLGLQPSQMVMLRQEGSTRLYHFWGAVYGELLASILRAQLYPESSHGPSEAGGNEELQWPVAYDELSIRLPQPFLQLPMLNSRTAFRQLRALVSRVEPHLSLGRFHSLLPPGLAHETAVAICDFPRFTMLYESATIVTPWPELRERLAYMG